MNAIVKPEVVAQLPATTSDVGALMSVIERAAADPTFDPGRLMQLLEVKERWEATEARKAFVADMAEFKKNPPVIFKNKHVGFKAKNSDARTDYDHATHAEVTYKIIAGLAQHGFSHRWITTQPNNQVQVECVITHRLGHSESFSMVAPPDTSGMKSPVQAIASTKTLLERYTLLGGTGLSTTDLPDADDLTEADDESQYVGEGQLANIKALLTETNASEESFLRVIKADALHKIYAASYPMVIGLLEAKRKKS